ncbi:MAG TPA: hypothetical protein VF275_07615 [Gammaproteobacteria bacterium]
MPIEHIHSFLVHPSKAAEEQPRIGGTSVGLAGRLFDMLAGVYQKSEKECNIDISFNANERGEQQNDCRDVFVQYVGHPSLASGRAIAQRLQVITTHRSGLGLLFLMTGIERGYRKLLVSRFPADNGILAEENERSLNVEFLERIFMKSATSYKAALYSGRSLRDDFWDGQAVDKQVNNNLVSISDYWIRDFLLSDFRTTSAAGTKRLALCLRNAVKSATSMEVKEEIASAVKLSRNMAGRSTSIRDFVNHFGLSDDSRALIVSSLKNETLFGERFRFSREEFDKHIAFQSVELDNGGILTAEASKFDQVFQQEAVAENAGEFRFTTEGSIVNRRYKSTKS